MTKILHIETRHRAGGAERNVNHFGSWQRDHGFRVAMAFGPDSMPSEVPPGIEPITVKRLVRDLDPAQDVLAVRDLGRLVRAGNWEVVHTHQSKAGIVGRVAARGRARVILHTVHMISFGNGYPSASSALFKRAERMAAGWTDVLIAVGEELRDRYLGFGIGRPDRFRVLHSPIDISGFAATRSWDPQMREAVREDLGLPTSGPVALVVSALEPRKRVGLVIAQLAPSLRQGWSLIVAGDGIGRTELEAQIEREGIGSSVRLLGARPDIARLMAASTVLVHAAIAEGVPQVVLQALAAGLPIVATDVVGLREVTDAGISVGAADGSDLAHRVTVACDNPPRAVPISALGPWSPKAVEAGIARLHDDLGLTP